MTCIWTLLSLKSLDFLYTSSYSKSLLGHSLYHLIHPEEVALARRDLDRFIKSKSFEGSITRCRIKNYQNSNVNKPEWLVMDIVMYVVTDTMALTFFHQQNDSTDSCGDSNSIYVPINRKNLLSSKHSIDSTNQKFYIIENKGKSVLLSWPDHSLSDLDSAHLTRFNQRLTSPGVSCCRCIQQPSRITPLGEKVDSLIIDYGPISFLLVQAHPVHKSPSPVTSHKEYHPYSPISFPPISFEESHIPYARYTSHSPRTRRLKRDHITFEHGNHCQSCGTASSPEWRRGPSGHKTLCNACGLRYSRSVARQGKIAQQQQQQQQQQHNKINLHSLLFQSQNTPPPQHSHSTPSSPLSSSSSSTCASTPLFSHDQNYMINMKYTIPSCTTDIMSPHYYML
ncbi:hypothetical protein BDB01DRAFT_848874 [Pilobolus umbonatus]|nr:hypothetical protein BDB01DRAFT_848874 [Pilobolus umbonatus]